MKGLAAGIPVLTAICAGLGTWLIALRKASGRVHTTEADALWKEAADIRVAATGRVRELEHLLREQEADCDRRLNDQQRQINDGARQALVLERIIISLEARMIRAGVMEAEDAMTAWHDDKDTA